MKHKNTIQQAREASHSYRAKAMGLSLIAAIVVASPHARAAFVLDDAPDEAQQQQQQFVAPPAVAGQVADDGTVKGEPAVTPPVSVAPPSAPAEVWSLTKGKLVGQELARWGERAGWTVLWELASNRDIVVPADTTFEGDFPTAAAEVIATLAANGVIIRTKFWEGNRTMVVTGAGTTPQ